MSCPQCCSQFISWVSGGMRTRDRRQQPSSAKSVQTGTLCGLPADVSLPITTQSTTPSKRHSKSTTTAATLSCSRRRAWSVVAAALLLPPWVSRAVMIICARRNSIDDVEGDQVTDDNEDDGISARELLEIGTMALLQDVTVAAFAACLVILPGLTSIRRMFGPAAKEEKHHRSRHRHHRSRHHHHRNKTSAALSFVLAATVLVLFIVPIWLDMASQVLSGLRIRADYILLTFANLSMMSSSMATLSQSLWQYFGHSSDFGWRYTH